MTVKWGISTLIVRYPYKIVPSLAIGLCVKCCISLENHDFITMNRGKTNTKYMKTVGNLLYLKIFIYGNV